MHNRRILAFRGFPRRSFSSQGLDYRRTILFGYHELFHIKLAFLSRLPTVTATCYIARRFHDDAFTSEFKDLFGSPRKLISV